MGIRTGQQFLDKLNGMSPEIYAGGEKVTGNVAAHPLFRDNARTYARLFDMQHDPAHQGALTYSSPATNDLVNASFLIPRSESDLVRRRAAFTEWAGYSHGFLGRSGDYMNSALTALASAGKFFSKADPVYGERIRAYYEYARENDLLATHTLVPAHGPARRGRLRPRCGRPQRRPGHVPAGRQRDGGRPRPAVQAGHGRFRLGIRGQGVAV